MSPKAKTTENPETEILGAEKEKLEHFGKPGTVQLISVSEVQGKKYTITAIQIPSMGVIVNTLVQGDSTVSASVFVPKACVSSDDDGNPVLWDMHAGNMVMR